MAVFASQFSLSLELTRCIPQIATASVEIARRLAQQLSASGSDILIEDDLVLIFGRNRLDVIFESSFKTVVQASSRTELKGFSEIKLDGGAGPTVHRCIGNSRYLSSLAQLSLLVFVYDPDPLTQCLRQALDGRHKGSSEEIFLPRYDGLCGTLIAIKEQTSAYRWEAILQAIELELAWIPQADVANPERAEMELSTMLLRRVPSTLLLQGLLDDLTAVQTFPERLVTLKLTRGTATIVAWAHKVLGITVIVHLLEQNRQVRFGKGPVQVHIEQYRLDEDILDTISLVSPDGIEFSLESDGVDRGAGSAQNCPHSVEGYGTSVLLYSGVRHVYLQTELAQFVLGICLLMHRRTRQTWAKSKKIPRNSIPLITTEKLVAVAKVLFKDILFSSAAAEETSRHDGIDCYGWNIRALPPTLVHALQQSKITSNATEFYHQSFGSAPGTQLQGVVFALCRICWALSAIDNFDQCHQLSLNLKSCHIHYTNTSSSRAFSGSEIWSILHTFLIGTDWTNSYLEKHSSIISGNGWSIVMDSVQLRHPGDTGSGLSAVYGVPSRMGERKRYVLDLFGRTVHLANDENEFICCHMDSTEQLCALDDGPAVKFIDALQSTQQQYIQVSLQVIPSMHVSGKITTPWQFGPRRMQEMCWNAVHIGSCGHSINNMNAAIKIPSGCAAYTGYFEVRRTTKSKPDSTIKPAGFRKTDATVHISSTASSIAGAWLAIYAVEDWRWSAWSDDGKDLVTYIRSSTCCLECAVHVAMRDRPGYPKILIT